MSYAFTNGNYPVNYFGYLTRHTESFRYIE